MEKIHNKCLLLNIDYSPLHIIDWKKAIIWSMRYANNSRYSIEIIDFYKNDFIQGASGKRFPIPAVAKTCRYFKANNQRLNFSRKNIFLRDNYTCQYCGMQFSDSQLTYDHVIPKSLWHVSNRSSATSWTNIVTACISCNRKKSNKTPKQANMPLKNLPTIPNKTYKYLPISQYLNKIREQIPQEWHLYLPEAYYS